MINWLLISIEAYVEYIDLNKMRNVIATEKMGETDKIMIVWNFNIQIYRVFECTNPETLAKKKKEKWHLTDVAVPGDHNVKVKNI